MASHRPYKCNVNACGKEFKFKAHLSRHHAVSHTPGSVGAVIGAPSLVSAPLSSVPNNSGPHSLVMGAGSQASAVSALGMNSFGQQGPHRSGSPRPIMKTRAAFYFSAPSSLRLARRICVDVLKLKHSARFPFYPINVAAFKAECK